MKKIFLSLFILSILMLSGNGFAIQTNIIDKFDQNSVVQDDPYNPTNIENNNLNGYWYCGDDSGVAFTNASAHNSKSLTLDMVSNDTYSASSHISLHTTYTLGVSSSDANNDNEWAYWELDCTLSSNEAEQDLSGKTLDFWIKGETNYDLNVVMAPNDTKANNDYAYDLYHAQINVTTSWQHIQLTFTSNVFKQAGWGTSVPFSTAITEVVTIAFSSDGPDAGGSPQFRGFWLDDLLFTMAGTTNTNAIPVASCEEPSSGSIFTQTKTNLKWADESSSGVNLYQVDMSTNNDFSTHFSGFPVNVSANIYSVSNLILAKYYWKVRCSTNSGTNWGDWSGTSYFTVGTTGSGTGESLTYIIDDFESYTGSLLGWTADYGSPDAWMGHSLGTNSDLNNSQFMNVGFYCANDSTGWMESTKTMTNDVYGYRQLSFWVKPSKVGMQFSVGYSITNRAYHYNDGDSSTGTGPGGTNDFLYQYLYTYTATGTNWEHVVIPHSKLALQQWFIEAGYPNPPIDYSKIQSFYLTSGYVDAPNTNWAQFDNIQLEVGTAPNVNIQTVGSIASGVFPISVSASYPAGISKVVAIVSNTQNHTAVTADMTPELGGKFVYNYDTSSLSSGNIIVTVKVYDNDAGISTVTKVYPVGYVSNKDVGKVIIHNNLLNFKDDPNATATIFYKSKVDMGYSSPALAKLYIYSVNGQLMFEKNITIPVSGILSYEWNGKDGYGNPVGAGIYLVKVQVGNVKKISRILIIR